jgi:hypothetical protein
MENDDANPWAWPSLIVGAGIAVLLVLAMI